jgi:hypothetical protein
LFTYALKRVEQTREESLKNDKSKVENPNEPASTTTTSTTTSTPSSNSSYKLDPAILADLALKAKEEYPGQKQNVIDDIIKNIELTLDPMYSQYLTVCKTSHGEGEIDVAILQALLKAKGKGVRNEKSIQSQLRLALKWNRVDIAKDYILTAENKAIVGSLDNLMYSAIKDDRYEFVDLFLENGFSLKSFLTYRILLKLYNEVETLL